MPKLSLKALNVIAICLSALIVIFVAVFLSGSPDAPEVVEVENVEAMNNKERIIYHSGDIYCYTTVPTEQNMQYMLLRLPIDFSDSSNREIVENFGEALGDTTLDVYQNKIFYKKGSTYMYDIVENKIDKFCEGEIQFMIEPNFFIMLQDGDLYKGRYYENTMAVNRFEKLAEGDFVRAGEDSERMYYYSSTGNNNTIVVGLNKETLNIIMFDRLDTVNQTVDDMIVTDNYMYIVYGNSAEKQIKKISKQVNDDGEYPSELLKIDKFNKVEFLEEKYTKPLNSDAVFDDLYFYGSVITKPGDNYTPTEYETKIYKYDVKSGKVSEHTGQLNERFSAHYSITSGDDGCTLYYHEKELTKVPTNLTNFADIIKMEVLGINIIEDYIYYEVKLINSSYKTDIIFARVPRDGGESQRINIIKKN